jgi:predicted nucleic acid-binding Zn ribbon protein
MSLTGLPNILTGIQSRTSWQQRSQYLHIVEKWSDIVGESVAKHTCPTGVYQKVLQVAVSNAVWSQALAFERVRILVKLNGLFGNVSPNVSTKFLTDIHFSTAKWATHQQNLDQRKIVAQDHPSYLPAIAAYQLNNNFKIPDQDRPKPPETANEAFQRWQSVMKLRTTQMPKCLRCDRPALTGEIARWQMCRVCAIEHIFN